MTITALRDSEFRPLGCELATCDKIAPVNTVQLDLHTRMRGRGRVCALALLLHFLHFLFYVHAFAKPCVTSRLSRILFCVEMGESDCTVLAGQELTM